ncbi:MerR family transcriptional regulator [Paenibacillus sp. WLX1005]|uniref:MerR family transcriptional regulator n=1 Tax=Paenibacillus sp. WLX1005 TaxID=3243766 RepID=UPI0039842AF5
MNEYFSVGETARLNNISIQTLRYYDKIGVFQPQYIDPANNYRYYHIRQFFYLDIIKYLKYVKTPLDEIRSIVSRTPDKMLHFLEDQEMVIHHEMLKLEKSRKLLQKRKKQLHEQLEICERKGSGLVYSRYVEKQTILKICTPPLNPHEQPDMYYRKLVDIVEEKGDLADNYYGYIYDFKSYEVSGEIECSSIYTTVCETDDIHIQDTRIQIDDISAGEYLCISFDWSTQNYLSYYQIFREHILNENIQTEGKIYQLSLPINYSSFREEQFLTEIRVKIKR